MTKSELLNRLYEIRAGCDNQNIVKHINKMIEQIEKIIRSGMYE